MVGGVPGSSRTVARSGDEERAPPRVADPWRDWRCEAEDFVATGDFVVVVCRYTGHGKESGVAVDTHGAHVDDAERHRDSARGLLEQTRGARGRRPAGLGRTMWRFGLDPD